jgi:hypothetical protein
LGYVYFAKTRTTDREYLRNITSSLFESLYSYRLSAWRHNTNRYKNANINNSIVVGLGLPICSVALSTNVSTQVIDSTGAVVGEQRYPSTGSGQVSSRAASRTLALSSEAYRRVGTLTDPGVDDHFDRLSATPQAKQNVYGIKRMGRAAECTSNLQHGESIKLPS